MLIEEKSVEVLVFVSVRDYAWLKRLERLTGDEVPKIITSMLRYIRIDDEAAHGEADGQERTRRH